jgi:hypothetical protein
MSSNACSKRGKIRKHTTWKMWAQKRTQKEVGLENTLLQRRGLKGTFGRKTIGLEGALSDG